MTRENGAGEPAHPKKVPIFTAPGPVLGLTASLWLVMFLLLAAPRGWLPVLDDVFFLSPVRFWNPAAGPLRVVPLVGHIFVHAGWVHIIFNSLWLLAFGTPVWRRLQGLSATGFLNAPVAIAARATPFSTVLFICFFLMGGIAGGLAHASIHPATSIPLVGASGGVSALLGAMVRFAFRRPPIFSGSLGELTPLTHPAVILWTVLFIVMNFAAIVFDFAPGVGSANISWEAHFGGYFFGLLAFPAFDRASGPKR